MSKLTHRIEKKAVEILVDRIMAERNPADRQKTLKRLSYVMQHLFGDLFEKESFDDARRLIDEGGKWFRFLNTALDTLNPHVVKTAVMDLGFEAGFYGLRTRDAAKAKYHCNIPWAILFDPTSACNLHCIGCWAAEYGHTLNLSFDVMDKIVREGNTPGMNAAAATVLAFMREPVLRLVTLRDSVEDFEPGIKSMGFSPFFRYILLCTFLFCTILLVIDTFSFFNLPVLLLKILTDASITVICILCAEAIRRKK